MQKIKITVITLLLAAISSGGLIKRRKMKMRETRPPQEFSDDESSMWIPVFPGYRFQYGPAIVPDQRMFPNFEDDKDLNNEDPDTRSFSSSKSHPDHHKTTMFRRAVLLWPRPCGWEWDGNMYKWGPCNTFFGGPGFPW